MLHADVQAIYPPACRPFGTICGKVLVRRLWEYFRRKDPLRTHRLHELPDLSAQTALFQRGFVHIPGLTLLTGKIYFRRTYFTLWENRRPCVYLMAVSHGNPVLPRKLWTFGKFDGNKPLGWTFLVAKHERRDLSAWRLPTRSI